MRRFFTESHNITEEEVFITEDRRHIEKVLRMEPGERIIVFDGSGYEYTAELLGAEKDRLRAKILEKSFSVSEPKTKIRIFQGIPKSGKMESIIQKSVELGVYEIVPVMASRCVALINNKKAAQEKTSRWNKVAVEAVKQCGRGMIPKVLEPVSFSEAIELLKETELAIMPYEVLGHEGQHGLKDVLEKNPNAGDIGVLIGPEGGFSDAEAEMAVKNGICTVGLGKRILRTETVAGAIIPVIMFYKNEF